jgi:hypothetical protein
VVSLEEFLRDSNLGVDMNDVALLTEPEDGAELLLCVGVGTLFLGPPFVEPVPDPEPEPDREEELDACRWRADEEEEGGRDR